MATLAEDLQNRGIRLEDPFKVLYQKKLAAANPIRKPTESEEDSSDEDGKNSSSEEDKNSCEEDDSVSSIEENMPKSAKKKQDSSPGLSSQLANLEVSAPIQTVSGLLGYPVLSGKWEVFNHQDDTTKVFCLMRMQIHNGTNEKEDFQLSWVDNRTFKIRLKWLPFI